MRILLVSTYELGNQPLGLASPAAALEGAGHQVRCVDVAIDPLGPADVDWADRMAFSVPMHTAMRLALTTAEAVRGRRPELPLCFYGLYAAVSQDLTVRSGSDAVIAGEYEPGLVAWAGGGSPGPVVQLGRAGATGPTPARHLLAPLERYTRLVEGSDEHLVGSVAASRGCSHRCRHCPVPVIYDGRVRPTDLTTVMADVDQLVAAGARHLTFTDPDFLNAPLHSQRIVEAVHRRHPQITFDCTVKVEHILRHPDVWSDWAASGCAFVVSAFESASDAILGILDKGHVVAEASRAVSLLRSHGIEIRPSWLPFTPWTTPDDLVDLFDFVISHDLVGNVDPVQYAVRLLVPEGSLLLGLPAMQAHLGEYDPDHLGWAWAHPDPAMDDLHRRVSSLVEANVNGQAAQTFDQLDALIRAGVAPARRRSEVAVVSHGTDAIRPRLSEPWFCCSEPTEAQLAPLTALG